MVFVVAVAAPWGDFRRGEEAGDEPREQSRVVVDPFAVGATRPLCGKI